MEAIFKRILIAVDDSTYAMKAAKTGFALAHNIKASVGLLYVINLSKEVINADLGITPQESQSVLLEEAERTIAQYVNLYNSVNEILRFTPTGVPEEEIINIAKQWPADLIVMGTHGRSAIGRILSGSTAEYVVRHATVPVLLTPPRME